MRTLKELEKQLTELELNRMILYNELVDNIKTKPEQKKTLCKIYLYETKTIDKKINVIRQIILRK